MKVRFRTRASVASTIGNHCRDGIIASRYLLLVQPTPAIRFLMQSIHRKQQRSSTHSFKAVSTLRCHSGDFVVRIIS